MGSPVSAFRAQCSRPTRFSSDPERPPQETSSAKPLRNHTLPRGQHLSIAPLALLSGHLNRFKSYVLKTETKPLLPPVILFSCCSYSHPPSLTAPSSYCLWVPSSQSLLSEPVSLHPARLGSGGVGSSGLFPVLWPVLHTHQHRAESGWTGCTSGEPHLHSSL